MTTREWLEQWGTPLCFAWGFAEGTAFFVVPDLAVGAAALFSPRRKLASAVAAVSGALVGGAVLYAAAARVGDPAVGFVRRVPGIPPDWFERVAGELRSNGGWALVRGAFSGVPYKLYALEMGLAGYSVISMVVWTVLARGVRMLPVALLAAKAGERLRPTVRQRPGLVLTLYAGAWSVFYVAYFRRVGRR
jgi:membrane protein YqaA with SNARE-associated domain